jgi:hypothetical protein
MKCLRPLEYWDHAFESPSRRRCLLSFCVCVVMCRQRPCDGLNPIQGVVPAVYKIHDFGIVYERKQSSESNPSMQKKKLSSVAEVINCNGSRHRVY